MGNYLSPDFATLALAKNFTTEAMESIINSIPDSLRPPVLINLESAMPDPATLPVGFFYIIQDMDATMPGRTGKAWVNYDDPSNITSPLVYYKVYDQYYSADGVSIVLTPQGMLSVDTDWLDEQLSGLRWAVKVVDSSGGYVSVGDILNYPVQAATINQDTSIILPGTSSDTNKLVVELRLTYQSGTIYWDPALSFIQYPPVNPEVGATYVFNFEKMQGENWRGNLAYKY